MRNIHDGRLLVVPALVLLLGAVSFSCSLAAEFKKAKAKDIEMDGSLCSLHRTSAFGLGIAAVVCLTVAQIVGTTAAATRLYSGRRKSSSGSRSQTVAITLLVLSWVSFGLAAILLGAGSSMNDRQPYGRGWLDGECYVVKKGVFAGAAALAAVTAAFVIGFIFSPTIAAAQRRTGPAADQEVEEERTRQVRPEQRANYDILNK